MFERERVVAREGAQLPPVNELVYQQVLSSPYRCKFLLCFISLKPTDTAAKNTILGVEEVWYIALPAHRSTRVSLGPVSGVFRDQIAPHEALKAIT